MRPSRHSLLGISMGRHIDTATTVTSRRHRVQVLTTYSHSLLQTFKLDTPFSVTGFTAWVERHGRGISYPNDTTLTTTYNELCSAWCSLAVLVDIQIWRSFYETTFLGQWAFEFSWGCETGHMSASISTCIAIASIMSLVRQAIMCRWCGEA